MTRHCTLSALLDDSAEIASALPAFVIDVAAAAIVEANPAGWRAWGLPPCASGTAVAIDRAMPAIRKLAAAGDRCGSEMLTFWTARGLVILDCSIAPVPGLAGQVVVRARADARNGNDAGPMATVREGSGGEFFGSAIARMAHEVRTPLSAAIAYAEVLKEEHFGPLASERYREYARTIYDSARHALSVVDAMLARDAGGSLVPKQGLPELAFQDLDPARVIDDCVAVAKPLAERAGLGLVASHPARAPRVIADEVSLKQMLLNLMTNAIKFARAGDQINLGLAYGADGCLRIEVADTGPGMEAGPLTADEETAAARESHGGAAGLGIGLPLTRALAEANGASLIVDSAPGCGTRVTIAFGKDRVVPV